MPAYIISLTGWMISNVFDRVPRRVRDPWLCIRISDWNLVSALPTTLPTTSLVMQHTVSAPTTAVKAVEPTPVTESASQCSHCGYRGSHSPSMCSLIVGLDLVLTCRLPIDVRVLLPCLCCIHLYCRTKSIREPMWNSCL